MPIDPYEKYPQSTDSPDVFSGNGDYFTAHTATKFVPQANTLEENVNAKEALTEQNSLLAQGARDQAVSATNAFSWPTTGISHSFTVPETTIFTDGHSYRCITPTSPGESPTTNPEKWQKITTGPGSLPKMPSDDNLVLYLPMDSDNEEFLIDYSGYSNNGIGLGSPLLPTIARGVSGSAREFDGLSSKISIGTGFGNPLVNIGDSSFCVSFWIKSLIGGNDTVFSTYHDAITPGFTIYKHDITDTITAIVTDGVSNIQILCGVTALDDNWHHVVFSVDRPKSIIYFAIDGVACGHTSIPEGFGVISNSLEKTIGSTPSYQNHLSGVLDEFRIYNVALSEENINALFLTPGIKSNDISTNEIEILSRRLEVAENNLILESFRRIIGDSQAGSEAFQDGWVDTLQDENNVDLANCIGQIYSPTGDYYLNADYLNALIDIDVSDNGGWNFIGTTGGGYDRELAQSFTLSSDNIITQIGMKFNEDPSSFAGGLTYRIETDSAGSPSGSAISGTTKNITPTGSGWVVAELDSPVSVPAGFYWLIVSTGTQATGTTKLIGMSNVNPYANGSAKYYQTDTPTWIQDSSNDDLSFTIKTKVINDMTLVFDPYEAETEPTASKTLFIMEPVDAVTLNTDIKVWASNDDGSTYEQITLAGEGEWDTGQKIIVGSEEMTAVSDKTTRLKITTHNTKELKIHAVSNLLRET